MWSKNLELAISAWRRWKPAADRNEFRLVIAGMVDAKSVPYLRRLRALAGDRQDIVFSEAPTDRDLLRLYQRCHAVVFPPPNEDWGLVPLEAMACGKPVLATDRGGPRESVVNGETGFLRLDRPESFAQAIDALAHLPHTQLDRMAERARARAVGYGWQAFVNRIDLHAEEIGAHQPAPAADRAALLLGT
jgi:glycosyltransferase involved in cell wall biosynthesis